MQSLHSLHDPFTPTRIKNFQKISKRPTKAEIEHWSPCAICWADYNEKNKSDKPARLRKNMSLGLGTRIHALLPPVPRAKQRHASSEPSFAEDMKATFKIIGGIYGLLSSLIIPLVIFSLLLQYLDIYFKVYWACIASIMVWMLYVDCHVIGLYKLWSAALQPLALSLVVLVLYAFDAWFVLWVFCKISEPD